MVLDVYIVSTFTVVFTVALLPYHHMPFILPSVAIAIAMHIALIVAP